MRKHPLIALSAFTAFGTTAFAAGTTPGTYHQVLTHSTGIDSLHGHTPELAARLVEATAKGEHAARLSATSRKRGRELTAMHDPNLTNREGLERAIARAHRHHKAASATGAHAPAAATQEPAPVVVSAPAPAAAPAAPTAPSGGVWYELRECESSDNYAEDTGNGYYGAYQFALSTWYGLGYSGLPSEAPPAEQDQAAAELQARSGWGQWPACAAELGLI